MKRSILLMLFAFFVAIVPAGAAGPYYVDNTLYDMAKASGTCPGGPGNDATHIKLEEGSGAPAIGCGLNIWHGSHENYRGEITGYDAGSRLATVTPSIGATPGNNDQYEITVGSDENAGDAVGFGHAFATPTAAERVVAAGEHVYIKGGRNYLVADSDYYMLRIGTAGTKSAHIIYEGYGTTPGDGLEHAVLDSLDYNYGLNNTGGLAGSDLFITFRYIDITQAYDRGFYFSSNDAINFTFCNASEGAHHGFHTSDGCQFIGCKSYNHDGGAGFNIDGNSTFVGCSAYGNTGKGIIAPSGVAMYCLCYNNGDTDIAIGVANGQPTIVQNNTIDGGDESHVGLQVGGDLSDTYMLFVANNIIINCSVGITSNAALANANVCSRNNLLYGNTANYDEHWTHTIGDITTKDPQLKSNYDLKRSSPCIDAGIFTGMNIGADSGKIIGGSRSVTIGN